MSSPADLRSPGPLSPTAEDEHESYSGPRMSQEHPSFPSYNINHRNHSHEKSSDGEGTVVAGEPEEHVLDEKHDAPLSAIPHHMRPRAGSHLTVTTQQDHDNGDPLRNIMSGSRTREQASRLGDDLALLQIERQVSRQAEEERISRQRSEAGDMYRSRSRRRDDTVDEFDEATNPVHEKTQIYKPVEQPTSGFAKFVGHLRATNFLIRYVAYIAPLTLILLIPLLLGALKYKNAVVGGVYLQWFMTWLEIVWLSLWAGRLLAKCLPWPIGVFSSLFTNNSKKWRDMGKQLELPATLFFWWLAIEVSFLPTMTYHQRDVAPGAHPTQKWMNTMNKVLVSLFVGAILNFVEKIIIQLIAISFHLRTYADRIEINKFQIGSLTKLYRFSRDKIAMEDSEFEPPAEPGSGARTPGAIMTEAAKTGKAAFNRIGDVAGKVAGDFTGKAVTKSTHPSQVVLALLRSTGGSQVLARRLYRTFAREDTETVFSDDLRYAFDNDDEADAAFTMFDKDMNGDISMEELEAVCVEIGRERKSITASLKDLDSVVGKLDDVFMFIVFVITVLVFISLISTSAAGVLTSAGSTVLALSWLFSATAQEFLQSVIFVFVKHPFDVGDRISVYGNTGTMLKGDDYFVKEISLLYTEFKKMEGHIVQAPNSYLNTLFILNQRRSGGLAEAVSITIKFGTTLEQIEGLRSRLLEFVKNEKREYQSNILTELRDLVEVHSMNLNVIFFYKSNWQNEGLRLARRNKFICAMMVTMQELGIEGPRMRYPGQRESFPVYLQNVPHVSTGAGHGGQPDHPMGRVPEQHSSHSDDPPFVSPPTEDNDHAAPPPMSTRHSSGPVPGRARPRAESLAQMNRRVDFSLGMRDIISADQAGDVYESRDAARIPIEILSASRERSASRASPHNHHHASRASHDVARSTSRDFRSPSLASTNLNTGLSRRSTDGATARFGSVHRNRFFGRGAAAAIGRPSIDDELARALESGGMAGIPEYPPSSSTPAGTPQRMDPRSGMVSPAAWRMDSLEGPGTGRDAEARVRGHGHESRAV